ncbi:MAG: hydrogenase [Chloroflexi bacterium]|nr:hydrogenase [Chloroflexota bacterium]
MREVLSKILRGPRYACSLGGAMTTILAINRGVPLVHSSPGCGYNLTLGQVIASGYQGQGYTGGACIPSTRFTAKQVVYGGEDRLRQQLKATLDWVDSDFVAILTGCTADLIGDDIAAIAGEFNNGGVPVFHFTTGGFKGNSFRGHEIVLEGLASQLMKESARREKGQVNVFGVVPYQDIFWRGDLAEIRRLLEKLGLKPNMMFGHKVFGLESWRKAPEAELNLLLSPWVGMGFVKEFEQRLGVPYLVVPELPVGPTATSALLRKVGEKLNIDRELVEKVVAEEEKEAYYYLDDASDLYIDFGWHFNFAVISDSNLAIGITKFLTNDMGYVPHLVVITDDPPDKYREAIVNELSSLNHGLKPQVVFESNSDSIWEIVGKTEADVILGSSLDRPVAQQLSASHVCISRPAVERLITNNTLCGYRGGLELLAEIVTAAFRA